jgi:YcxB-like protein
MLIRSKLTQQEFINASLVQLYSKTSTKVVTGLFALFLLFATLTMSALRSNFFFMVIYPIIILALNPLGIYLTAKRSFKNIKTNGEMIEYHFEDNMLFTKGETFSMESTWDTIYKVTQTNNWLLIWRNRQVANPIPKSAVSKDQLVELKGILDRNHVKNNL